MSRWFDMQRDPIVRLLVPLLHQSRRRVVVGNLVMKRNRAEALLLELSVRLR